MTNGEIETDWRIPFLKLGVIARARDIASSDQSANDQLKLARAHIENLFGAMHGPGFARRVAWGISDVHDKLKLRAAATEKGEERVARSIVSQTKPVQVGTSDKGPIRLTLWVLLAEGAQEEDLVIIERASNSVRRPGGVTIRRRRLEDPEKWFTRS